MPRFKYKKKYHEYGQVEKQPDGVAEQRRKVNFYFVHVCEGIQVFLRAQDLDGSGGAFQEEIKKDQPDKQERRIVGNAMLQDGFKDNVIDAQVHQGFYHGPEQAQLVFIIPRLEFNFC